MPIRRAVVAACALLVAAGCSSGHSKTQPPASTTTIAATTTTAAPTTTSTSVSTTTSVPVVGPSLSSLILTDAPSQYPLKPDAAADTGPTNLQKAALDDALNSEATATQVLRQAGFVAGYQRQWATSDSANQNFIFLYQFATPAGAQSYVQHWQAAIESADSGAAPVAFTPTFVPGAIGLTGSDSAGTSGVVLFAKGVYAVQALSIASRLPSKPKVPTADQSLPASALAAAQYALLP